VADGAIRAPLVAVFGTAGKSTTCHCAWCALGPGAARIGTTGWHDGERERPNQQTTPPPEEMHDFLASLSARCPGVAMEISSHGCDQQRLAGLVFSALAFTGFGHDHLDYHRTSGAYLAAKLKALRWLAPGGTCIVNANDGQAHVVSHAARAGGAQVVGLGFDRGAVRLSGGESGWTLVVEGVNHHLPVRLPGSFNAWNAAAGALLATACGVPLATALTRLAELPPVPGRLELLARRPDTYVDYAHTPDEIATMLAALRRQFPARRLVCVFGCGGDRDRTKRGPMGRAALAADLAVLTTDNSRSEDPLAIAEEVIAGLPVATAVAWCGESPIPSIPPAARLLVQSDRAAAIRLGRSLAGADGVVVVAGKGHETCQIIQGRTLPWDDRAFVASLDGAA
jgi:UDP-N-acetylmuramoyl-L-alanyl-D-glutamate--2,6-diaminopimelate ligase